MFEMCFWVITSFGRKQTEVITVVTVNAICNYRGIRFSSKYFFLPWLPSQFSRRKKKRKKKASQVVIDHRIGIELEYGSWFAVLFRGKRFSEIKRFSCLIHYVPILHRRFSDVSGAKCRTYDVIIANSSFGTPHSRSLIIHGMRSRFQLFKNKFRSKHSFCNPIPLKSGETGPLFT